GDRRRDPVQERGPAVLVGRADAAAPGVRHEGGGHVTRQGSRLLRWALIEAIQRIPRDCVIGTAKDAIIARPGQHEQLSRAAARREAAKHSALRARREAASYSAPRPRAAGRQSDWPRLT